MHARPVNYCGDTLKTPIGRQVGSRGRHGRKCENNEGAGLGWGSGLRKSGGWLAVPAHRATICSLRNEHNPFATERGLCVDTSRADFVEHSRIRVFGYETLRTQGAFESAFESTRSRYGCSCGGTGVYGVRQCIRVILAIVEVAFASPEEKSKGSFADASFVVAFKLRVRLTRGLTLPQLRKDARARRRSPSTLPWTKVHNVYSC